MPFISQNHKILLKVNYQFLKTIYVEFKILYVFKNLNTENILGRYTSYGTRLSKDMSC